ncbi:caspase-2 [Fopius arisanus]|uniref:Caspase-2 n=1 Tax=Fopius arisanus TaxID=64838 RepID=A0A9R1T0E8_9HYME|nr:PREDICTED: caspase-2 [Fopius arisanus]
MQRQHRHRIDLCQDILVQKVDIVRLFPKLLEHKIFYPNDVNIPRWQANIEAVSTITDIITTIKTRGPSAFENLIRSLREIEQPHLAKILLAPNLETASNNNTNNVRNISQSLPQDVPGCVPSNTESCNLQNLDHTIHDWNDELERNRHSRLVINVRKSTEFQDMGDSTIGRYPMRSKPRGLVLLITLVNYPHYTMTKAKRAAAETDHKNLQELFEQMGFQVIPKWDLSAGAIKREVCAFSQMPEHRKMDSCFVIVCGHGDQSAKGESVIKGTDDTENDNPEHHISQADIINYFSVENCPGLSRKPKIFIFQCCRGESSQLAVTDRGENTVRCNDKVKSDVKDTPSCEGTRNIADICIVNATTPGYVSFRDSLSGSWFVKMFCLVFMNMACSFHLRDLLTKIDELIARIRTDENRCQTTCVTELGFKHLYINPGLFPEDS